MRITDVDEALAVMFKDAHEAVQAHLDTRDALLYTSINGWKLRHQVPWQETAEALMAWVVETTAKALRTYRELMLMTPAGGPLMSPVAPELIRAGAW